MKKQDLKFFYISLGFITAFILWTAAVCTIDVQAIGPEGSAVGFAALNKAVHELTGVHMSLYVLTDWLGLVPFFTALGFAVLGLCQWIKRKHILKVDRSILVLGGFYLVVMGAYLFFEAFAVNYRPVLINGFLEASYPSSTTVLVMCVMPAAVMQINSRVKKCLLKRCVILLTAAFTVFMVTARLISGVHWFTDIIGGAILSIGLVMMYYHFAE